MDSNETLEMLTETLKLCGNDDTVQEWLKQEGIDEEAFGAFLVTMKDGAPTEVYEGHLMTLIGMGFQLGWTARKTQEEARRFSFHRWWGD